MLNMKHLLIILLVGFVAACGGPPGGGPQPGTTSDINALTQKIISLGPDVDPNEAARAAQIAYDYTYELAQQYQITDPPLIHNMKVNTGRKPRGLCWHWAEDMENRLNSENFQTLELHRAIANHDKPLFIEHSTAIIGRRGDSMYDGVVIDPWRYGGKLFWEVTREDTRYGWEPQLEVLRKTGRLIVRGEPVPAG